MNHPITDPAEFMRIFVARIQRERMVTVTEAAKILGCEGKAKQDYAPLPCS